MRRREFMTGVAATVSMGLHRPVHAQTNAGSQRKRIALFHPTEPPEGLSIDGRRAYKTYFGQLRSLGYVEGQNLIVERYSALGHSERFERLARDIVASQPDLIVCVSGHLALLLKLITATIPILATSADPVAAGLVTNLARPDGNITGVSADAGLEVNGKRLQFLGEAAGKLTNVRFLTSASRRLSNETLTVMQGAGGRPNLTIALAILDETIDRDAFERVFAGMEKDQVDGLIVGDSPEYLTNRRLIVDLAAKHRLPVIYPFREFVEVGGLLSYGIDAASMMRRLADMTDEVLRGAKPADIPFQQQTKFELVLNRTTARALAREFPLSLVTLADEVMG